MDASARPAAFLSYDHLDDRYGHVSQFRERLADEVCIQTGEEFLIFQDRSDIQWGENWRVRIAESLDSVAFIIPIITPSFFKSEYCRSELRFEPFDSPRVGKEMERLAAQIREALDAVRSPGCRTPPSSAPARAASSERLSAHQKTEHRTIIVDQMHRGDHTTISEAIMAARPGDRILVKPGLFEEEMTIDKPLEILGDGDLRDIVIRAAGKSALSFKTVMGRVSNLTLQQANGDECCVDISQGRLELDSCDITGHALACVAIHSGADPRLRKNRIHDGRAEGISIHDNGLGILEENDIYSNAGSGVAISRGGSPILRKNRVNKNGGEAIRVFEGGQGTIEENDLRDNLKGPWSVSKDCERNLKRSGNLE